ncbi:MAG: ABC transporter ATP-binding protein [Methanomassiliicoccales archaeon]
MSDNSVMISIQGVRFSYGSVEALRGLTIEGKEGELIGLIGPNGSGKSTLLRCINGILRPKAGRIEVGGKEVGEMTSSEMARLCANVPTEFPEEFNLSVLDLVFMGRYPYVQGLWWEKREDEEVVMDALGSFQVRHLMKRKINEISSGEKQRALLAKAVVQSPRVMLVDEPSAHLDLRYKLEAMEYLRSLLDSGLTIIVASHDINLLARYCDRVIILSNGSIVSFGPPGEVVNEGIIQRVYGVQARVIRDDGTVFVIPDRSMGV